MIKFLSSAGKFYKLFNEGPWFFYVLSKISLHFIHVLTKFHSILKSTHILQLSFQLFCVENSTTDDWCPGYMCPLKNFTDFEICVEDYHKCNGVEDCDDGSDELTEEECGKMKSITLWL